MDKVKFTPKLSSFLSDLQDWEQQTLKTLKEGQVLVDEKEFKQLMDAHATMAIQVESILQFIEHLNNDPDINFKAEIRTE
jgi:hypothetical protein